MKRFFSLIGKLMAFVSFAGVILYCIGYFFASKSKKLYAMLHGKRVDPADDE